MSTVYLSVVCFWSSWKFWCEISALLKLSVSTFSGVCLLLRGDLLFSVIIFEHLHVLRPECLPCCAADVHVLALMACLFFSCRWTSLGSFGAGLSTVLFPAVIRCQWLRFPPLSSSYLLFFILAASFTRSRRSGYSFCVSDGAGVSPLESGGARDLLGSRGRGGPARSACSCADGANSDY